MANKTETEAGDTRIDFVRVPVQAISLTALADWKGFRPREPQSSHHFLHGRDLERTPVGSGYVTPQVAAAPKVRVRECDWRCILCWSAWG